MASTQQQTIQFPTMASSVKFPPLRLPDAAIAATVKVRLGDTYVSAVFPARK